MKKFRLSVLLFALSGIFVLSSCTKENILEEGEPDNLAIESRSNTIVDIALSNPDFSILVDAVVRAGLVDALSGPGPFTVFAPTNTAFQAFLSANGFNNVNEVPVPLLTTILTTHVLSGEFFAANISTGYFNTLATSPAPYSRPTDIFIQKTSGVTINGSINVVVADVDASNGVVHVVDKVIAPSDVLTLALSNPNFSILVQALTRPDLSTDFVSVLSGNGPFTILAPTNAAFQALLNSNPAWNTLNDIPAATLEAVLKYHVAAGVNYTADYLYRRPRVNTLLSGSSYTTTLAFGGGGLSIRVLAASNQANVIAADVQGQNGVIHAIDTVILP